MPPPAMAAPRSRNTYAFVVNDPSGSYDVLGLLLGHFGDKGKAQEVLASLESKFKNTDIWFVTSFNQAMAFRFNPAMSVPTYFSYKSGGSGYYNPIFKNLIWSQGVEGNPGELIHELIHAYVAHYLGSADMSSVQEEGLASAWSLAIFPALKWFHDIEIQGFSRPTCSEKQDITRSYWQSAWTDADYRGKKFGVGSKDYRLVGNDVVRFRSYFLIDLDCPTIAARYNDMAADSGCCFFFSCDAGPSTTTVARPEKELPSEYQ